MNPEARSTATDAADRITHQVRLWLPLSDNAGRPFPATLIAQVRAELTDEFGGVTAFVHSPALGTWKDDDGDVRRDQMLLFEIIVPSLDRTWWTSYRHRLEAQFQQEEILMVATAVTCL